ncbi:MAG: fluoride efflux transporter CrcB, partial [Chlorobiaceae bacterium]|nr:fluoride efflux transporter CrcB [Chlorobiaceae bacterium]
CGGFTTFSAYMFEHAALLKDGQLLYAGLYLAGSIAGGIVAFYLGTMLSKLWT